MINNKTDLIAKISLFIINYKRELRMEIDIRRKGKMEKDNRVCRKNEESL